MLDAGHTIDNRYEIEALIGEGGLAHVYRVRHVQLGSVHALKLLSWRQKGLAQRMLLEGRIQAQLKHPNVVSVTDVLNHDGQLGLLMEYVDHLPLPELLERRGHLSVDEALELFAQILAGVNTAHRAGVLHRDLKPQNILLARSPKGLMPKVTDFGIAKLMQDEAAEFHTIGGVPMGTPGYMAPEQVTDSASVDARADVFSLGVILFELLTGVPAFVDPGGAVTVGTTLTCAPRRLRELNPGVPEYISAAYLRAVAREREDRFESCEALADALLINHPALRAVVSGEASSEPITLYPSGTTSIPDRSTSRPTMDADPPRSADTYAVASSPQGRSPLDAPSLPDSPALRAAALAAAQGSPGDAPATGLPDTPAGLTPLVTTLPPDARRWGPVLLIAMVILLGAGLGGGYLLWGRPPAPVSAPVTTSAPASASAPALTPTPVILTPPKPTLQAPADDVVAEATTDPKRSPGAAPEAGPEPAPQPGPGVEAAAATSIPEPVEAQAAAPEASDAPAETEPAPAVAEAAPAVAETPPAPPPPQVPQLQGSWAGSTSTSTPMSLEIVRQEGERLVAVVSFRLGATTRSTELTGSVDPQSLRVILVESDGEHLKLQGVLSDANSIRGTYIRDGQRKALEWSVQRRF
ncbi:MAG: protein kinase [Alphaproteobacteria bacterium]|nr:protein kinase [Alphaproteobacteria bacterium]